MPCKIRPGKDPTYVRRWPRISASSRIPPKLIRTKSLSNAVAILLPREVLPTPGGPTKQIMDPRNSPTRDRTAI